MSMTTTRYTQVLTSKGEEDAKYPHPFELKITVALREDNLEQELSVTNTGQLHTIKAQIQTS